MKLDPNFKIGDLVRSPKGSDWSDNAEGVVVKQDGVYVDVKLSKASCKEDIGRTITYVNAELELLYPDQRLVIDPTKIVNDIVEKYEELAKPTDVQVEIGGLRDQLDNKLAARFNSGKPKLSFVHPIIMEEIARVMEYGAKKYARDNWRKGLPINSIIDSALRHLMDFKEGSTYDKESNETELGHAACNIMFAMYVLKYKPELDDRVKNERAD